MVAAEVVFIFLIILLALYLFIGEKLPAAATALLIMVLLIVSNVLTPEEGVSGFSNPATITVLCMFIISEGVQKTGIVQRISDKIFSFSKKSIPKQILAISFIVGPMSGFINNTASVSIMIPTITRLAEKTKINASKLLIPLSYIAMAGGTLTIIGTSTNILASDVYRRLGYREIGLFEITNLGFIVFVTTALYLITIGRFLLPERKSTKDLSDPHAKLLYHTEIAVHEQSPLINQKVKECDLCDKFKMEIVQIKRNNKILRKNIEKITIKPHDTILVNATREELLRAKELEKIDIKADLDFPEKRKTPYIIAQFMVPAGSPLLHRTLYSINFRGRYKAVVLGLKRGNLLLENSIEKIQLKIGDILLVRTTLKNLEKLKKSRDFIIIGEVSKPYKTDKLPHALGILLLVVLLTSFSIFPIMVSTLIGVLLMVVLDVLDLDEGFKAVNWEIIFLLAGIIPLGMAFEKTGTADILSNIIIAHTSGLPPVVILGIFYLLTTLLTEIMSNNASIVLITPIAVDVAIKLSLNPFAFLVGVMFAASTSFLTPIGYQTNTMVYSAGNYRFKDFFRVGLPLNVILLFVSVYFINRFWGL